MFFGYIDPGAGSLFLQAILGVVLGGLVVFRQYFRKFFTKIKTLVTRQSARNENK